MPSSTAKKEGSVRKKFIYAAVLTVGVGLLTLTIAVYAVDNKQKVKSDQMTGYQETPGVSSTGTGSFTAEIDEDVVPPTITYELTYSGLSGPALVSHIHFGNRFDSGGVSAFFCGGGGKPPCPPGTTTEATVTGTITPADVIGPANQGIAAGQFDRLVHAIREGLTYANVHTSNFPAGEIRAQVNDPKQRQPR